MSMSSGPTPAFGSTGSGARNSRRRSRSARAGSACRGAAYCSGRRRRGSIPADACSRGARSAEVTMKLPSHVGLDAAIQEVQRLADKAAAQHIPRRKSASCNRPSGYWRAWWLCAT